MVTYFSAAVVVADAVLHRVSQLLLTLVQKYKPLKRFVDQRPVSVTSKIVDKVM